MSILKHDFVNELQKLEKTLNKEYNDEMKSYLYEIMKVLNAYELTWLVNKFIDTRKTLPLPSEYKNYVSQCIAYKQSVKRPSEDKKIICDKCCNTGYRFAEDKQMSFKTLFVCDCNNGEFDETIQTWDVSFMKNYNLINFPKHYFKPKDDVIGGKDFKKAMGWWRDQKTKSIQYWKYKRE